MQRPDESTELRVPNGVPRATDRALYVAMVMGILVLVAVIYSTRDLSSSPITGPLSVALAVGAFALGMTGNRRRRPAYLTFSADGIRAEFGDGRLRSIPRSSVDRVRLYRFLGDTQIVLHYSSGRWEEDVHIYGNAAMKVKEWFDNPGLYNRLASEPRRNFPE